MQKFKFEKYVHAIKVLLGWAGMNQMPYPGATGVFERGKEKFIGVFKEMEDSFNDIGLSVSGRRASIAAQYMQSANATWEGFRQHCAELYNVVRCESEGKLFLYVPPEKAEFFENAFAFGEGIQRAFPSAAYDIEEAAKCFALGRNTASVFHLMRVLETGLHVLASKFDIPTAHTNWQNIIQQVQSRIDSMAKDSNRPHDWKDQLEFYSQATYHFAVLKDAWRNYTAHARGNYDEHEARRILDNVRGFMEKLGSRLAE